MSRLCSVFGILLAVAVSAGACGSAAGAGAPVRSSISILRQGEVFLVDAVLIAPVSSREAWAVLTDFDHMSAFVPGMNESRVLRRSGNRLTVLQKGVVRLGFLGFDFESLRDVELEPEEVVRSRNIGGNLRRLDSLTRFHPSAGGALISYHVEIVPDFWMPGFIAEYLIRSEIQDQFEAVVNEMLRRRAPR
ncbi:MAG TPA: SRPBCC family protein [Burkholderiales bacterium]|nr:SRPBCC family protein [Burkholderiales bacterium]